MKKARSKSAGRRAKDLPSRNRKAGKVRGGAVVRPQTDDQVLVSFAHGDVRAPYVVGGLWNSNDKPKT
jgi:uncharacterized protein involved in type VI secretion and phage assembly